LITRQLEGDLEHYGGEISKLRANVERLAGVFHMAKNSNQPAYDVCISGETMGAAVEVGHYWLSHAIELRGAISKAPDVADAERVLRWIRKKLSANHEDIEGGVFAKQRLYQWFKSDRSKTTELDAALSLLIKHGFLREKGKTPKTFSINPIWIDRVLQGKDMPIRHGEVPRKRPLGPLDELDLGDLGDR
jgi:hypothetical protein